MDIVKKRKEWATIKQQGEKKQPQLWNILARYTV